MNYYRMLNESFENMLLEAKQDEINFSNVFGQGMLDRFKAQKQRMKAPENDFYHWIRASKEDLNGTIEKLDAFLSELEGKKTRSQKSKLASEGADVVYEDDEWIVLKINTYEAAQKYGAGSVWCITGRYEGHEERGEEYFNSYRTRNNWDYYFYIKKDGRDLEGRQEKWCLCLNKDNIDSYEIWEGDQREEEEEEVDYIPDAPHIDGLPDVSEPKPEPEEEEEIVDEPDEPHERLDMLIPVDNPNAYEFPAATKEEAARAFKEGAEIVDSLDNTLHIVKWHEEPAIDAAPEGEGDAPQAPADNGDRFSLFVFFPGEGGGPLLAQTGEGFALQVFKTLDAARDAGQRLRGGQFNDNGIRNNGMDMDAVDMPECLEEHFFYHSAELWD